MEDKIDNPFQSNFRKLSSDQPAIIKLDALIGLVFDLLKVPVYLIHKLSGGRPTLFLGIILITFFFVLIALIGMWMPRLFGYLLLAGFFITVLYNSTTESRLKQIIRLLKWKWMIIIVIPFMFVAYFLFASLIAGITITGWGDLLEHLGPLMAPIGFQNIQIEQISKVFDIPRTFNVSRTLQANGFGELGYYHFSYLYTIGCIGFVLNLGFWVFTTTGSLLNLSIRKWIPYNIRYILTLALFIFAFVSVKNDKIAIEKMSRPLNDVIYKGHAYSLVEATLQDNREMVTYILSRGGDPHKKNQRGYSAIDLARMMKNEELLNTFN